MSVECLVTDFPFVVAFCPNGFDDEAAPVWTVVGVGVIDAVLVQILELHALPLFGPSS